MAEPIVEFSDGKIRGLVGENICGKTIYKFLGVPYGKPPVGELRFKAPQPVDPWEGIRDATKDGDASYNHDTLHERGVFQGGEDCLVLNVFTKHIDGTNDLKPVMVYIHGGGFVMGCNKSEIYGPEFLLTRDIVVVVINYRLGLLGFLSLEDEALEVPGNAGLKDQRLALQWVQKNIKSFGGDPNNVTIFGESAGSASVHFQVLSESSKGLFHKAILESGTAISTWALSRATGPAVAAALDKSGASDKEVLEELRKMNGKEVFEFQHKIKDLMILGEQRPYGPIVEKPNKTAFITKHPFELITSGNYNHVPLLIGYTSHEGLLMEIVRKLFPGLDNLWTYRATIPWILNATDEVKDEIETLMSNYYGNVDDKRTKDEVMMDVTMLSTIATVIIHHSKTSKCPVYAFRIAVDCQRNFFKHVHSIQDLEGTCHADELGFLWNIQSLPKVEPNTLEFSVVQRLVKLWTNFAISGNPTSSNDLGVTWSPVKDENNISILNIGKELTVLKDLPERERVELWKKIFRLCEPTVNYL